MLCTLEDGDYGDDTGDSLLLDDDNCHLFYVLWKMGMIQDGMGLV